MTVHPLRSAARARALPPLYPEGIVADRFRIIETIGVGGSATVFEAEDLRTGEMVALKAIPAQEKLRKRARREIRAAGEAMGFPGGFGIGVAGFPEGHPETPNTLRQIEHLKAKVDAGADWICSQMFFDNRAFLDWCERCRLAGIRIPILAGIMPITSLSGL